MPGAEHICLAVLCAWLYFYGDFRMIPTYFTKKTTGPAEPESTAQHALGPVPVEKGRKDDTGKNRLDLVEPEFIEGVGRVLTYGAAKYEPNNWQKVDNALDRYYASLLRHLLAWRRGEKKDAESGLSHLEHVAANVMFLLHFEREAK